MDSDERIKNCLDEFGDDLWMKRRLELQEVIDRLEKLDAQPNESNSLSNSPTRWWIRFIKLLEAECSGGQFSNDKQWSELMNLMQISRKLNHRSVKFKDIIRNRQLIESNESSIRKLNESVRLCQTIGSSLDQLESMLDRECRLKLKQDPQQQLDELLICKSFIENSCRQTIRTLQIELDIEISASCGPQLQVCRERVAGLANIIGILEKLLNDLQALYYHQLQLGPLINVDGDFPPSSATSTSAGGGKNSGLDQLDNSVATCKRVFAQVQEFCGELMGFLNDLASQHHHQRAKNKASSGLRLMKLVNSRGQLTPGDLLVSGLEKSLAKLDECRKILDSVVRQLRLEFGRFYFVSDLELLTIIALDSRLVLADQQQQQHQQQVAKRLLCKLFNNSIEGFIVDPSQKRLLGVRSPYNEIVLFSQPEVGSVAIKKSVNLYSVEIVRILNEILRKLRKTLQFELNKSLQTKEIDHLIDWMLPVQLMIVAENVKFCRRVEEALRQGRPETGNKLQKTGLTKEVLKFYEARFNQLSCLQLDDKVMGHSVSAGDEKLDKFKLSAAISTTVQFISILGGLDEASSVDDWQWIKLARYYRKPEASGSPNSIEVRIADTSFDYRFVFLAPQANDLSSGPQAGGFKRLINTKITERCLLAASQSIGNFRLGSSPYGPAGSGKTETIKALGLLLGCQVIVHNCDESNDGQSLDQLVWGLAHTGLWGCFDEFNRLSSSTLSSISSSLELVQASIRESKRMVELPDGRMMPVEGATAFFVTMNPADPTRGYRGRRRLPTNLKQLFLPVAMMRVQMDAIVSESLLALGAELGDRQFHHLEPQQASLLGGRLANFIETLARELIQNSATTTCVWDLRLVLAILKRLKLFVVTIDDPSDGQQQAISTRLQSLLVRSVVDEIEPRLTKSDQSVFRHLLKRNFPTSQESESSNKGEDGLFRQKLEQASIELFPDHKMAAEAELLALKLKHQIDSRAGVILLGPARSGKSTTWRLLQSVLSNSVDWIPVNPRSCPKDNLFGSVDHATGKWIDGLLTSRVRQAHQILLTSARGDGAQQVWLVLDGPIDPDWIETFNSVLDDNQVLTLSSGERLNFNPALNKSIRIIVECDSLEFASPASISRLGMVLHEPLLHQQPLPRMHLSLTASRQEEDLKMARAFMAGNRKRSTSVSLVVVSGQRQNQRSEFVRNLFAPSTHSKIIEYNCGPSSNCNHLLQLVAGSIDSTGQECWFVINNVHLIEPEGQWRVKSFMELLRFMVTYGGFYAGTNQLREINAASFVITLDSEDNLDPRTLAQGCSIEMGASGGQVGFSVTPDLPEVDAGEVDIGQILLNEHPQSPIITLSSDSERCPGDLRSSVMEKLGQHFTILTFRNSKEARRSVDALEELLNKFCGKSGSGSGSGSSRVKKMFLLSDLECKLMEQKLRANLCHQLSRVKGGLHKIVKIVFLAHNLEQPDQVNEATFWLSLGPVILVNDKEPQYDLAGKDLSLDEAEWLRVKVKGFFESGLNQSIGHRTSKVYLSAVTSLIRRFRVELEGQSRTLGDGLSRLEEFEGEIERVKSRCQREELESLKRKEDIARLVGSIDKALEEAKGQRNELNELKQQQVAKRHELELKRAQLNRELSDVSKLVDGSKLEVSQYLKPEALNEIKALRSPPATIKDILDVLFTLLRLDDDLSWASIRAHLTKCSLKDELTSYNFQKNLDESLLNRVTGLMEAKRVSFTSQQAARASRAVVPILGWIRATIEYGRVLVRLKPLQDQMEQHELDARNLSGAAQELELRVAEVDARIGEDSARLADLRLDYEESQRVAAAIRNQLDEAQLARHNLEGQIMRWRLRLTSLRSTLDGRLQLIGLCCLVVSMMLFYDFHDEDHQLEGWMKLFGFKTSSRLELASRIFDLTNTIAVGGLEEVGGSSQWRSSTDDGSEHVNRVLQLLCIRLHLELGGVYDSGTNGLPLPPLLLDVGSATNANAQEASLSQEEVVRYLTFKSLSCHSRSNVAVIKCNDDWIQSIEMALRFGKLVLVDMSDDGLDLDIMDHVLTRLDGSLSTAASNNNTTIYKQQRLLLLGRLDKHTAIRHLVRPVRLLTGFSSLDEIQSGLMELLLNWREPELSSHYRDLEHEFRRKQLDCRQGELRLLNRLATINFRPAGGDSNGSGSGTGNGGLHEDLVGVLGELHRLNGSLELVSGRLGERQAEVRAKQDSYKGFTREISQFYLDHLANLSRENKFYNFPLETYLQMLIEANDLAVGDRAVNYERIVEKAKQPMRPEFRQQFELGLPLKQVDYSGESSSSLQGVINELLLNVIKTNRKRAQPTKSSLMVVLHDQTKSSPQLEVDEFFRLVDLGRLDGDFSHNYTKFYATGGSSSSLETTLMSLMASKSQDNNISNKKSIQCICIANAHLAARWLNGRLIKLLQSANAPALVILIGESSGGGADELDSELLDYAQVKYWHDDSMLELTGRFNLLVSSMLSNRQVVGTYLKLPAADTTDDGGTVKGKTNWASEILAMAEQTLLFHVVCQERARSKNTANSLPSAHQQLPKATSWICQNYSFDYDQLCLALKTLGRLKVAEERQWQMTNESAAAGGCVERKSLISNNLRERYCHYLANFVYGSRMETLEDEQSLDEMIERFLGSRESAGTQMSKFRLLEKKNGNKLDYEQQLNDLLVGVGQVD